MVIVPQNDTTHKEGFSLQWIPKNGKTATPISRRIFFLDELRGFAVLCMIFYHGFFTFSTTLNWQWSSQLLSFFQPVEPLFAALFLVISGIAANLTRSNLLRGTKLAVVAACVTIVTVFVTPEQPIYFGILHLLSVAMLLTQPLKPLTDRIPIWTGIGICFCLTALTYHIWEGFLGFFSLPLIPLPEFLYQTDWLCWLGTYSDSFFSVDYFPIFPWLFVYFGGVFFGRLALRGRFPKWTYQSHVRFFSFLGRHALLLYIVHQPVFYGIAMLIRYCL